MYYFLLIVTAVLSYAIGSLSSLTISSMYVFKRNLRKLGKGNAWLSNFRRIYGIGGLLLLLLVEVVRDLIPIFIGGILFVAKEHADVGRVFAGFCLIMGRLWPLFYDLKGSHATICVIVTAFFVAPSAGIVCAVVVIVTLWFTKYFSVATVAGAFILVVTSVLVADVKLLIYLSAVIALVVTVKHIPSFKRIAKGTETKLSLQNDLNYKFDEKFK